jgi:single-stranded DNA-binding protein
MAQTTQNETFYLYGNLGGDPEPHSLPAKSGTRRFYDPILYDVVEREYDLPERNFLTFSIAVGGYGDKPVRWHYCVDWEGLAFRFRKGDRVKLSGHFQNRSYTTKDGETKTVRQFVVVTIEPLKLKVRDEIA